MRFLENLDWYLKQPLEFTSETKHSATKKVVENLHHKYPIGLLGGDVEIHFMHCKTEKQALEKWNRRLRRINTQAMFLLFSDGWEFEDELFEKFDKLPFEHKLFICEKPRKNKGYTAYVEGLKQDDVNLRSRKFEKKVDLVKWLNGEPDFIKTKN